MHIDSLEAIWIASNAIALVFTIIALVDARKSQLLATRGSVARQIVANGNVRREWFRLIVQLLLTSIVIPGIFTDNPTPINYFVVILLSIPIVLVISTVTDYIERKRLANEVWDEVEVAHRAGMDRLEAGVARNQTSIEENTQLTRDAGTAATAAYHEANTVNLKIANLQREDIALQKDAASKRENE